MRITLAIGERPPGHFQLALRNVMTRLALALAASVFLLTACSSDDEPEKIVRISLASSGHPIEAARLGGITRRAVRFVPDTLSELQIGLGSVAPGRLIFFVGARDIEDEGSIEWAISGESRLYGLRSGFTQSCTLRWREPETPEGWRRCSIDIPGRLPNVDLSVSHSSLRASEILITNPFYVPSNLPRRPNIFVLLADTARADRFQLFGSSLSIGQNLEALAQDGIVFDRARAPSSWTRTSVATLLTGLRPRSHRVFDRLDRLSDDAVTLAEILQDSGYLTHAWSSNPNILPVFGFSQGFDFFADVGTETWTTTKTDASELVDLAIEEVKADEGLPGFYYVHFMDPHAPYLGTRRNLERLDAMPSLAKTFPLSRHKRSEEWEAYRNYLAELLDFDEQVGRFVRFLKEADLYEKSLILIVSDHGEEFLDHGDMSHGKTLFEEMLWVPAILKPPNSTSNRRVMASVGLEDMLPSILDLIDLKIPLDIDGHSVISESDSIEARPHVATLRLDDRLQSAIVVGNWKLILYHYNGKTKLFDLSQDPHELTNLSDTHPETTAGLHRLLEAAGVGHAEGWHLRACGSDRPTSLRVQLANAPEPFGLALEERDTIQRDDSISGYRVTLELSPEAHKRSFFGEMVDVSVSDEDEIVIGSQRIENHAMRLKALDGVRIEVRLGIDAQAQEIGELEFGDISEIAKIAPTDFIGCTPNDEAEPYLLVWYVPAPEKVLEEDMDPAVAERLRALGYAW